MQRDTMLDYSDLIGLPYGWRESGHAYDCFTLVAEVFARLGWKYQIPVQIREQFPDKHIETDKLDGDIWTWVPTCREIGDVALIRGPMSAGEPKHNGIAKHCAIMVGHDVMLEATERHGVHVIRWSRLRHFAVACVRYSGVYE